MTDGTGAEWAIDLPGLRVPASELSFRATRAGGPGGQHVNTSSSRVEVLWDFASSPAVDAALGERLRARLARRLDAEGRLRVVAQASRSQWQNRADATARLAELVAAALTDPKPRRPTKPSKAVKRRRLEAKRHQGQKKADRRRPPTDE